MTYRALQLAAVAAALASATPPAVARDYFVDHAAGNDGASATSAATAWKSAPGDPAATGQAAATRLQPGDTVRLRGGVAYRGVIAVNADGTSGRPITFSGKGFGEGAAIIAGADPVDSATPCSSAEACGGAAEWRSLSLVTFKPPTTPFVKFYDATGPLVEAQSPVPADPFYADDIGGYASSPLGDKAAIEAGRLRAPALARLLAGRPAGTLSIWVAGNQVARRPVTGIDGDTLLFAPDGIRLYDNRPGRYALLGVPAIISAPGQYAVLDGGRAVVRQRSGGGALRIGAGRGGFELRGRSHVVIEGFTFANQTGAPGARGEGTAIVASGRPATGLVIRDNRFVDSALWNGTGVITLRNQSDARITGNLIEGIERGSGLRVANNVNRLTVSGNTIRRVGRTGIAFLGVTDGVIDNNIIEGLRGIHGNGISLYLANRGVAVTNNRVTCTTRPMTFHGDKSRPAPGDHNFRIERNVFAATEDGQAALTSWGANTRGVTITGNLLLAPKAGALLKASDTGVRAVGNIGSSVVVKGDAGSDWTIADNKSAALNGSVGRLCAAAGLGADASLGGAPCAGTAAAATLAPRCR